MRRHFLTLCLPILIAGLAACELEETPAKELGPFNTISSNGSVKFTLIQGVENKVISTSISETMYNVSNGQLTVNAPGGSMTIAVKNVDLFWCNSCDVSSSGVLIVDTLNFYIHAGSLELHDLQANKIGLSAVNTGKYKLSGSAIFFNVYMVNLASIEAFDLITDSTYVNSLAAINSEVHATQKLSGSIFSAGNVYYKGNPPVVTVSSSGAGKVIPK